MSFDSNIPVSFAAPMDGCPVCGDPTGNCKGDSTFQGSITFEPKSLRPDPAATFTVPKRVYRETKVGKRTVKKLLHPIGARITIEEAKELGLIPRG